SRPLLRPDASPRMSSLEIGLIVAGAVLVIGVLIYNWWEQRRVRARIDETFSTLGKNTSGASRSATTAQRVEPSLKARDDSDELLSGRAAPGADTSRVALDDVLDD